MLTAVKSYDILCYQLRNSLYPQLDNPLKKEMNRLSKDIKEIILSGSMDKAKSFQILAEIFNLRIKAIRWLASGSNFSYMQMLNEVIPQIQEMKSNKRFEVLTENLLFALRCNQRVIEKLATGAEINGGCFSTTVKQLREITYEDFLASLAYSIPDDSAVQRIVDWTNASLQIEFAMVAADIISNDDIKISDKSINALAFFVADAAQEYSALATELGIIQANSSGKSVSGFSFDKSFIKEQKLFADLGIEVFSGNF